MLNAEYRVVGFDSSAEMLARFRVNCPDTLAFRGTVTACPLANGMFDAAVAWGVLFHLTQPEQAQAIANVSRVLKAGAPFLFTSGDADGREPLVWTMNGVEFHYYSFSVEDYRRILDEHAFTLTSFHTDERGNSYYLAAKRRVAG